MNLTQLSTTVPNSSSAQSSDAPNKGSQLSDLENFHSGSGGEFGRGVMVLATLVDSASSVYLENIDDQVMCRTDSVMQLEAYFGK